MRPEEDPPAELARAILGAVDVLLLRRYLQRDFAAVTAGKRRYWARRYREEGPAATLDAAHALFAHLRAARPDYPTARDRALDLAHHVELKRRIDRAAHAFAVR